MSSDEVEKMKRDAELHADDDKKRRELIDEKNKADSLVYQVENAPAKPGTRCRRPTRRDPLAVEKLKKAKEGDDLNALKSAFSELEQAAHAMAAAQASRAQQGGGPGPGPQDGGQAPPQTGKKDGDDVVDAEFEVK